MITPQERPTRQIYASVREDLYLAAKARSTELRIPLRKFLEEALELALTGEGRAASSTEIENSPSRQPSIWEDEYVRMQSQQPVGSPVELSEDEAKRLIRQSFSRRGA
tara:strand:- start:287 stop:610 length:324 start_codon:yes stop_codon:yes gene_type:complete